MKLHASSAADDTRSRLHDIPRQQDWLVYRIVSDWVGWQHDENAMGTTNRQQ